MSERSKARKFWELAVAAGWSTDEIRAQLEREDGVRPTGIDFRFEDGSRLKWISSELPGRYAPDEEPFSRREQHRASAVEIAQQKAAGG